MDTRYVSRLPDPEKKRYISKVELISKKKFGDDVDPYEMKEWVGDVSGTMATIEFGSIYVYLVDTPGEYTREKLKAYKSLEAYNYYSR